MTISGRAKRFTWTKGDIKVQIPQCANCLKNMGPTQCEAFGLKPEKYVENKFKCPEKITKA